VDQDVGAVARPGSTTLSGGTYTVTVAGGDVGGAADAYHLVYQPLAGDGQVIARVAGVDNTDPRALAGVMVRAGLAPDAANALVAVTPGSGVVFQSRASAGGDTTATGDAGFAAPYWVRLVRAGNVVTGYRSADGVAWTQVGDPVTLDLGAVALVGLAAAGRDGTVVNDSTFDNVAVLPGA
jgi:hypothetical protein